jgi:hypothetical protein
VSFLQIFLVNVALISDLPMRDTFPCSSSSILYP